MIHSLAFTIVAAPAAAKPPGSDPIQTVIMMVLMVVMFYFLMIRPQARQRKELAKRIDSLQTGDKVITSAGIHALVHNIKEKTVILKVADGTMVEFEKSAVSQVIKKEA